MPNNPKSRQSNLVVQNLENEILIYDLNLNKVYCLNETSAMVWQFCDGKNSVTEISRLISVKLKMQVSDELVWLALDGLQRENLLGNDAEFKAQFAGFSRRQAIKKVGLASMIALPFISSAFAPMAISAQSDVCAANPGGAVPGTIIPLDDFCQNIALLCCSEMLSNCVPGGPLFIGVCA